MVLPRLNRRQVIKGLGYSLGALALRGYQVQASMPAHFTHGVASGDPLQDRVILWTRVIAGNGLAKPLEVTWQVADDEGFEQVIASGTSLSSLEHDFTVKVDATGLEAGTGYYYRFIANGEASPVGRTRTLPKGDVSQFKIGIASCANYPQGYFNVYADMAKADLDLVVHLGDYIYEYADGVYVNPFALEQLNRHVIPNNEIVSLDDYRMRYGLYRTDMDLQNLHQRHPFVCVWDDHELANNTWKAGAENHNEGEGDFATRMDQAIQAFYEWLPIRENLENRAVNAKQEPIFRSFPIGDLADLIMLDTRLHGRDEQLDYRSDLEPQMALFDVSDPDSPTLLDKDSDRGRDKDALPDHHRLVALPYDLSSDNLAAITDYQAIKDLTQDTLPKHWSYLPNHQVFKSEKLDNPACTILGLDQEAWLGKSLTASQCRGATWQIIGQQVLMGHTEMPTFSEEHSKSEELTARQKGILKRFKLFEGKGMPLNLDAWDGYPNCRDRVYQSMLAEGLNPVVLAGDTHNAWAFNLKANNERPVGVEIGAPSITSPGLENYMPIKPELTAQVLTQQNAELVEVDASRRGWAELTITKDETRNQFHFVDTILSRDYAVSISAPLICKAGKRQFS